MSGGGRRSRHGVAAGLGLLAGFAFFAWAGAATAADEDAVARGRYLANAGGCLGCHTNYAGNGAPYAGGRALATPFGTFYSPNLTPDPATGLGGWTADRFVRALTHGRRADGAAYFPVFPFTSYARMRPGDAHDIFAYFQSLEPVENSVPDHDVGFPFSIRALQRVWQWLFLDAETFVDDPARSAEWNRGAYLVQALAHCGECHTPRNAFGAPQWDKGLIGTPDGPDGERVPNITPDPATGIGDWSEADIASFLESGLKPNYDDVQGSMKEAIRDGLKELNKADRTAIAVYLKSLPPVENRVPRKTQ
ncbi:c-type cytochrome [Oceanibacterium hippocampi]|uniref:Fructose dehydrogenase cytochrome subunit n=1 Tax=Oceanibacterium hippocampi TaxID=745714 RepID=A0A1Y5TYP0_9PROT|nr:cytochrome c [Oceanibacterium hippocampi]SLN76850.1 Fructose dehydrogenase cytochrome subunit precursor [Oceanibacterium hippocampi]